jgi:hypothetical protein
LKRLEMECSCRKNEKKGFKRNRKKRQLVHQHEAVQKLKEEERAGRRRMRTSASWLTLAAHPHIPLS